MSEQLAIWSSRRPWLTLAARGTCRVRAQIPTFDRQDVAVHSAAA
jgi:hypothetical protein